jgi:hypothetical protein
MGTTCSAKRKLSPSVLANGRHGYFMCCVPKICFSMVTTCPDISGWKSPTSHNTARESKISGTNGFLMARFIRLWLNCFFNFTSLKILFNVIKRILKKLNVHFHLKFINYI